ncbi:hypothetical protein ETP77_19095, partial [Acinetobacter baumannii]
GPIGCAVDFVCRLLHLKIISLKKPLQIGLCNKAPRQTSFPVDLSRPTTKQTWPPPLRVLIATQP